MAAPGITIWATLIEANPVDYLIIFVYFGFVLAIGWMASRRVSTPRLLLPLGPLAPRLGDGAGLHLGQPGGRRDHGDVGLGCPVRAPTVHYFWVGAIPAMLFLGIVMMPFYYGSKVRSVPEFMLRRFGPGAHLVNSISFAVAQLLIAGVNLYLLGSIVRALLGWPLWVALIVAAVIVLSYITLGGLKAAIYNEVLQFFVIVASLTPLTLLGLYRVGGWDGLTDKLAAEEGGATIDQQLNSWPGQALSGFDSRSGRWSASCSDSASCSRSATGPRTSSRSSARWPPTRSRRHARHRSSVPSRRCSSRSSRSCRA